MHYNRIKIAFKTQWLGGRGFSYVARDYGASLKIHKASVCPYVPALSKLTVPWDICGYKLLFLFAILPSL